LNLYRFRNLNLFRVVSIAHDKTIQDRITGLMRSLRNTDISFLAPTTLAETVYKPKRYIDRCIDKFINRFINIFESEPVHKLANAFIARRCL